jgi:hypothetical protein
MTPTTLIRWSGLAAIVAGVLQALFPLMHPDHNAAGYASPAWVPVHFMPNLGMLLMQLALVGLLARQLERAGALGVAGFVVAFVGTGLFLMGGMMEMFVFPYLGAIRPTWEEEAPPAGIVEAFLTIKVALTIGYALLGAATARAGVLPRSVGVLLAVGMATFTLGDMLGMMAGIESAWIASAAVLGVSQAWLGYALWTGAAARRPARSAAPRAAVPA